MAANLAQRFKSVGTGQRHVRHDQREVAGERLPNPGCSMNSGLRSARHGVTLETPAACAAFSRVGFSSSATIHWFCRRFIGCSGFVRSPVERPIRLSSAALAEIRKLRRQGVAPTRATMLLWKISSRRAILKRLAQPKGGTRSCVGRRDS